MKESYGEGVANRTGPESCGGTRKGSDEALTGVRTGRVLSREIDAPGCRCRGTGQKATLAASLGREASGPCAVGDPEHVRKHSARESGDPRTASEKRVSEAAPGSLRA
jgi:hypothetical protein